MGRSILETSQDCARFRSMCNLLSEPVDIADRWLDFAQQYEVKGKQVHDARLAALADSHSLHYILTLNPQDFTRFQEVKIITPLDALRL
ncbi:MAG: hypothetical protein KIT45_12275 [Fimbriimonadia bacterium]|nr:hypothetical protein [Fimbriimonadia bacterium]